jgi:hypothetical protein
MRDSRRKGQPMISSVPLGRESSKKPELSEKMMVNKEKDI